MPWFTPQCQPSPQPTLAGPSPRCYEAAWQRHLMTGSKNSSRSRLAAAGDPFLCSAWLCDTLTAFSSCDQLASLGRRFPNGLPTQGWTNRPNGGRRHFRRRPPHYGKTALALSERPRPLQNLPPHQQGARQWVFPHHPVLQSIYSATHMPRERATALNHWPARGFPIPRGQATFKEGSP